MELHLRKSFKSPRYTGDSSNDSSPILNDRHGSDHHYPQHVTTVNPTAHTINVDPTTTNNNSTIRQEHLFFWEEENEGQEIEEEDPLSGDRLPEHYTRVNLGWWYYLEFFILISGIITLVLTGCIGPWRKTTKWKLPIWKWEALVLVVFCGRLVSRWGITLIKLYMQRQIFFRKHILYFVYRLRSSVQNFFWLGIVLLAWYFLFVKELELVTKSDKLRYVTKSLICSLIGSFLWFVKKLMVEVLSSSFYLKNNLDRILKSLFNQFVIETLSGLPLIGNQSQRIEQEVGVTSAVFPPANSGRVIGSGGLQIRGKKIDNGITIQHLHKLNRKNISAWSMDRLMNMVRHRALTTLDEQIPYTTTYENESATQIKSEFEAKATTVAEKIFQNVSQSEPEYIHLVDLMQFMREGEALNTMNLFEGASENKKFNKSSLQNWMVNALIERRALIKTLEDTRFAVNKVHQMLDVIVGITIGIICLLIFNIATTKFFVVISSQLLLLVFIFGNTCKMIFEAILFLFISHPYDVGDKCEIDGMQMVVEKINIMTTVFMRYEDNVRIEYPNSSLCTKPISNFNRSPDMTDMPISVGV